MDCSDLNTLFGTAQARWFERLDRCAVLVALMAVLAGVAWWQDGVTGVALAATGLALGSLSGSLLMRQRYRGRCDRQARQALAGLDTGLLGELARAPTVSPHGRQLARAELMTRVGGRALILT